MAAGASCICPNHPHAVGADPHDVRMRTVELRRAAAVALTASLLAGGLSSCAEEATTGRDGAGSDARSDRSSYDAAVSTPQRDSIYPQYGTSAVDALHYDLDLAWDPARRRLTGVETVTFRTTRAAGQVALDLGLSLEVTVARLDGRDVRTERDGHRLLVQEEVEAGATHELELEFAGAPASVPAPTRRGSLATLGWSVAETGEVTTIQQPYGAFTWYAVNDTPSDKAFHDVTLRVPENWVGISNGALEERSVEDGLTVTRWHGSAPAAPSAMTVAIGDYVSAEAETGAGTPVTTWTRRGDTVSPAAMSAVPELVDWLEARLGDYPFDAVGAVVIPGMAGSDTQETITVGTGPQTRAPAALVEHLAHQWFGGAVTPADWSDLWIAEGVPFYLADGLWSVEHNGESWKDVVDRWRGGDRLHRRASGAPTAYEAGNFGPASVEYGSALMWRELAELVEGSGGLAKGEERGAVFTDMAFTDLLRSFVEEHAGASVTREDVVALLRTHSRLDYTAFLAAWLDGRRTPPAGMLASAPVTGH